METIIDFITGHWELLTACIFALLFVCVLVAYLNAIHKKRAYANKIVSLTAIIEAKDDEIVNQETEYEDLHAEYEKVVTTLVDRDKTVEVLQTEVNELKATLDANKIEAIEKLNANIAEIKDMIFMMEHPNDEPIPEKKKSLLQKIDIDKLKKAPHELIAKVAKVFKIKKKSDAEVVDAVEDKQIGIILDEVAASEQLAIESGAVETSGNEDR